MIVKRRMKRKVTGTLKIVVGSLNPTKIDSVKQVFTEAEVTGVEVESKVAAQPFRMRKR